MSESVVVWSRNSYVQAGLICSARQVCWAHCGPQLHHVTVRLISDEPSGVAVLIRVSCRFYCYCVGKSEGQAVSYSLYAAAIK